VVAVDQLPPSIDTRRPETFAKKFRSTISWPILACNFRRRRRASFRGRIFVQTPWKGSQYPVASRINHRPTRAAFGGRLRNRQLSPERKLCFEFSAVTIASGRQCSCFIEDEPSLIDMFRGVPLYPSEIVGPTLETQ
jgi:hypothetical protein